MPTYGNLAIAAPTMKADLELTEIQWGLVMSAFPLGYALLQFPGGCWADRYGTRRVLTGGVAAVRTGGAPAVAVLYRRGDGQGKVQVRNAVTGKYVRTLTFVGHEWEASAIASLDANSDRVTDVGVLAVKDNGSGVGVQVRDAASKKQLNWVGFPVDDR